MATHKLVRCEITRPGGTESWVRFVPLEIYGLWEYLMRTKHQFEVSSNISCPPRFFSFSTSPTSAPTS